MQRERILASQIIDLVEDAIRKAHPKVDRVGKNCQGNTLLYGEKYYDVEDLLTEILLNSEILLDRKKRRMPFNPSKRA
jgi:hypothetical protein